MKLYDCRVRLGGNILHEIPKYAVTEKEIFLLRSLHGSESCIAFKSVGEARGRTDQEELQRLASFYGQAVVEQVFKTKLEQFADIVEETDEEPAPEAATMAVPKFKRRPIEQE